MHCNFDVLDAVQKLEKLGIVARVSSCLTLFILICTKAYHLCVASWFPFSMLILTIAKVSMTKLVRLVIRDA